MGGVGGPDHVRVASLQRLLADEHLTDARLRSSLSGATATSTMEAIPFALHGRGSQGDLTGDTK